MCVVYGFEGELRSEHTSLGCILVCVIILIAYFCKFVISVIK